MTRSHALVALVLAGTGALPRALAQSHRLSEARDSSANLQRTESQQVGPGNSSWGGARVTELFDRTLTAVLGTAFGALLAFYFERTRARAKDRAANLAACKRAQVILSSYVNGLEAIRRQVLEPRKDDKDRHLTIKPYPLLIQFLSLDIASLTFMLDGDGAQVVNGLIVTEQQFRTAL